MPEDELNDEEDVGGVDVLPDEIDSSLESSEDNSDMNYLIDLTSLLLNAFKFKPSNEVIALLNSKDWRNPDIYPAYKKVAWIRNLLEKNKENIIHENENGEVKTTLDSHIKSIQDQYGLVEENYVNQELLNRVQLDLTRVSSQTKEGFYKKPSNFTVSKNRDNNEVTGSSMDIYFHIAKLLFRLISLYESTLIIHRRTPDAFKDGDIKGHLDAVLNTYDIFRDSLADLAKSLPEVQAVDTSSGKTVDPFDSIKRTFKGGLNIGVGKSLVDIYDLLTKVFPDRNELIKRELGGIKEILNS